MKLKKLKLKNFRGYSYEVEIEVTDLNVIIGKNDIGKSTILEALDIFFNGKPEKDDWCINNDGTPIEMTCVFNDLQDEIILDDSIRTSLAEEYLLNDEGDLEIKKKYPISNAGSVSEESYIVCNYPDNENLANNIQRQNSYLYLNFVIKRK